MSDVSGISVHPTSVVEDGARLGAGVTIGPLCHIGAHVRLGDEVSLLGQVSVQGDTTIGRGSRIFPFASIGSEPQDLKYHGEPVTLEIGEECIIREGVTMNPGTEGGGSRTKVGNRCTFLANSHVAHDCIIGDNVIFSNGVMLAGHCVVGDNVIFGGGAGAHQFCRIGRNAFIGGLAGIEGDVIPFGLAIGNRAKLGGLNIIGMKRSGIAREEIHAARSVYKQLFHGGEPITQVAKRLRSTDVKGIVAEILDFVLDTGDRALCTPGQS